MHIKRLLAILEGQVCFSLFLLLSSWFGYKYAKPLPDDIVRFTPYVESEDQLRGTTVLPYLEAFYQYGTEEGVGNMMGISLGSQAPGLKGDSSPQNVMQECNWVSEDGLFDETEGSSMASMYSEHDRSLENITQRKSRVSSTEDGNFYVVYIYTQIYYINYAIPHSCKYYVTIL